MCAIVRRKFFKQSLRTLLGCPKVLGEKKHTLSDCSSIEVEN